MMHMPCRLVGALVCLATATSVAAAAAANTPVFCTDLGVDFTFASSSKNHASPAADALAASETGLATSCLRHTMMHAVGAHLTTQMDAFAVSAVDCVYESTARTAVSSTTTATTELFAVFSVCSRSNVEPQAANTRAWDATLRTAIDATFGAANARDGIQTGGAVLTPRRIVLSPSYTLPDGKGMPRFELRSVKLTVDATTGVVSIDIAVLNTGKVPLHLFQAALVDATAGVTNSDDDVNEAALFALLPTPAAVAPGASVAVQFHTPAATAATAASVPTAVAIAAGKRYVVYISHSGFRSHRFEGVLERDSTFTVTSGIAYVTDEQQHVNHALGAPTTSAIDPLLLSSFPLGSWRVFSVAVVAVVGLVATLYTRRRWSSVSLRRVTECVRQSLKTSNSSSNASANTSTTPAPRLKKLQELVATNPRKSKHSDVDAFHDTITDREIDDLESERLLASSSDAPPVKTKAPRLSASRETKMPAIQMHWPPQVALSDSTFRKQPPLDLDGSVRLDPKRFENMWDEYLQRFQSSDVLTGRINADALVTNMQALGVTCMASGTVNNIDKFVFYAQPRASRWFFFLVLDVTRATNALTLTLRTSSDASDAVVDEFVRAAKTAIRDAVATA